MATRGLRLALRLFAVLRAVSLTSGTIFVTTGEANTTFSFPDADAAFGGQIPPNGIFGSLYKAEPIDACEALKVPDEALDANGTFVIIERGGCVFDIKVAYAQEAGFSAAIVYNNDDTRDLITMVAVSGRHADDISIPAVFITKDSAQKLFALNVGKGVTCQITPSFDNSAWSVMAVCFISLLAVSAILATFFFVRRHQLRRIGSRLLLIPAQGETMSAREVKALPSGVYQRGRGGNGTTETCAICLDDYEEGEKLRILPCDHEFHMTCVDQWLTTRRPFCPVCKRDARERPEGPPQLPGAEGAPSGEAEQSSANTRGAPVLSFLHSLVDRFQQRPPPAGSPPGPLVPPDDLSLPLLAPSPSPPSPVPPPPLPPPTAAPPAVGHLPALSSSSLDSAV
eukprot:TRINITY_DN1143_c0_g1_i1.p1 TRINITY_DN1143_c0_g1~~TRINITY_DN1143_c0_g1_i1.p1  ORF type:complete len:397 (+),score=75.12 TRINITY_DN1143_c0_g1_i1:401-1591(+)